MKRFFSSVFMVAALLYGGLAYAFCGHMTLTSTAATILPPEPARHALCFQNTGATNPASVAVNNSNLPTWLANHVYAQGYVISDGTNIQRCSTAGTSGAAAPTWATSSGSTTTDNTATWTVMTVGVAAIAADFTVLPTATTNNNAWQCLPNPQPGVLLPGGAVSAISASGTTLAWCSW